MNTENKMKDEIKYRQKHINSNNYKLNIRKIVRWQVKALAGLRRFYGSTNSENRTEGV